MVDSAGGNRSHAGVGQSRKLHKARDQILIDGVCAGLAEYLHMSPTAVRAAFVILAFTGFWGIVLYVLSMVLIPRSPVGGGTVETVRRPTRGSGWVPALGFGLVILGAIFFLGQVGLFQIRFWRVWEIGFRATWPLLVVILGWVILLRHEPDPGEEKTAAGDGLWRSRDDRMVAGVCSGLGQRLKVDASLIRVLWAFLTILSWGLGAVAYGVLVLGVPEEHTGIASSAEPGPGAEAPEKIDPADTETYPGGES
jgi:phage shock protein C